MKILVKLVLTLVFGVYTQGLQAITTNELEVPQLSQLTGSWVWTREANNCTEIYRYFPDGKFITISGKEITTGTYHISKEPLESGRYELTIDTQKDYGGVDCAGDSESSVGVATDYLLFNEKYSVYLFMTDPVGESGFGPLYRVSN